MPPIIRSMMSVPGIREKFMENARTMPADLICFDLEDSVAPADKATARSMVADFLPTFEARERLVFVRVNGLDTGLAEEDLEAVVGPHIHGINVPKIETPEDIEQFDHYLTYLEKTRGLEPGGIALIPWLETTQGVSLALEICMASDRLIGACMGGEDFATSLGVQRTPEGLELSHPRAAVAIAANAAGIVAIDTPDPDFKNTEQFERNVRHVRQLGYRGKFCIHPTQVEIANRVLAPDPEQIEWARRVVAAYEEGERQGVGAVALDGEMIDRPIVLRARDLLEWQAALEARAAALEG